MKKFACNISLDQRRVIEHPLGNILTMLREDDCLFQKFGEIYFSEILPDKTKGWTLHTKATCNYCVPIGKVKFVVVQNAEVQNQTEFDIVCIGESNYRILTVPPNHWVAFKCLNLEKSLVANFCDYSHDPEEQIKAPINSILPEFAWDE